MTPPNSPGRRSAASYPVTPRHGASFHYPDRMEGSEERVPDARLVVGAPLSLTGRYGFLGRLAAAGLRQVVQGARTLGGIRMGEEPLAPELQVVDDGGTRAGVRGALEEVAEADLLVGPYGSDLVDEAARWAAGRGRVLWNHGGSADEVERLRGVVSVPSPASRYLGPVLEALAESLPGARVLVAAGRGPFGRSAALGAGDAADRLGMTFVGTVAPEEVPEASDADVVLAAGTFAEDVELVRRLRARPTAVAAVAAGISLFGARPWGQAPKGSWARPNGRRAPGSPSTWDRGRRRRSGLSGPRSSRPSGPGPAASTTRQRKRTRPASSPSAAPRRPERRRIRRCWRPPGGSGAPRSSDGSASRVTVDRRTTRSSWSSGSKESRGSCGRRHLLTLPPSSEMARPPSSPWRFGSSSRPFLHGRERPSPRVSA